MNRITCNKNWVYLSGDNFLLSLIVNLWYVLNIVFNKKLSNLIFFNDKLLKIKNLISNI